MALTWIGPMHVRKITVSAIACVSCLTGAAFASHRGAKAVYDSQDAEQIGDRFEIRYPLEIGRGYNPLTEVDLSHCVKYERTTDELGTTSGTAATTGTHTIFTLQEASSFQNLKQQMEVSAAASMGFGIGRGSAEAQYLRESSSNRYAYFFTVRSEVTNPTEELRSARLTDTARALVGHDPAAFVQQCGTHFVSGRVTGGSFFAIVRINTESLADYNNVQTRMSGSYGAFSGTAALSSALQRVSGRHSFKMHVIMDGNLLEIPTTDSLLSTARRFGTGVTAGQPQARPVHLRSVLRSYFALDETTPSGLHSLLRSLDIPKVYFDAMERNFIALAELANGWKYVENNLNQFESTEADAAEAVAVSATAIDSLRILAILCSQQPSTCAAASRVTAASLGVPLLPSRKAPRPTPPPARTVAYTIRIETSGEDDAGTDGDVRVTVYGERGRTQAMLLDSPGNDFERRKCSEYIVDALEVGGIRHVELTVSNRGSHPRWFPSWIVVVQGRQSMQGRIDAWVEPGTPTSVSLTANTSPYSCPQPPRETFGGHEH